MHYLKLVTALAVCLFVITSCEKSGTNNDDTGNYSPTADTMTSADDDYLSSLGGIAPKLSDLYLNQEFELDSFLKVHQLSFYNQWGYDRAGTNTVSDQNDIHGTDYAQLRRELIARILLVAANLANRQKHQFAQGSADEPFQDGIGYSYGSKEYLVRQRPPAGTCNLNLKIHGLDCSGLLYLALTEAGLPKFIKGTANEQRKSTAIEDALHSNTLYREFTAKTFKQPKEDDLEEGDLIFFLRADGTAFHVGIVGMPFAPAVGNGVLAWIVQSHGKPSGSTTDCLLNLSTKKGVRWATFSDQIKWSGFSRYEIVRIAAPDNIVGRWKVRRLGIDRNVDGILNSYERNEGAKVTDDYFEFGGNGKGTFGDPQFNSIGDGSFTWSIKGGKLNFEATGKFPYFGVAGTFHDYLNWSNIIKYTTDEFSFMQYGYHTDFNGRRVFSGPKQEVELYR